MKNISLAFVSLAFRTSRRLQLALFVGILFSYPTTSYAYELISGEGTPMRTEITDDSANQRLIEQVLSDPAWVSMSTIVRMSNYGLRAQREEMTQIRRAIQSGRRSDAREIVTRIVQRSSSQREYLNANSNQIRKWTVVNRPSPELSFVTVGFDGVTIHADSGSFRLRTNLRLEAHEQISAAVIWIGLFDVWGEPIRNFSYEISENLDTGYHFFNLEGPLRNQQEASRHYQALFFVERLMLADGTVIRQDMSEILEALQAEGSSLILE